MSATFPEYLTAQKLREDAEKVELFARSLFVGRSPDDAVDGPCIDCGYEPCECEVGYGPVTSAEEG